MDTNYQFFYETIDNKLHIKSFSLTVIPDC